MICSRLSILVLPGLESFLKKAEKGKFYQHKAILLPENKG